MTTFADRLKSALEGKASQADLARKCGVSGATISDWMRNITNPENIKADPLLRAAAFLEVNPMWLLTGRGGKAALSATVLTVEEPATGYSNWPFENCTPSQYYSLSEVLRSRVQGLVEGALLMGAPVKSNGTRG